ncbi:hypothetical protein LCGC14_0581280 [marine sediment metagenome]|uniref:Polysaccharide biosynthesis protein C-terminal domain-containing protein n=1 Tax=marine sediment metagenome TaxID=412755 RepID=A0A0F9RLC3_9ZZZZ|nr:MAG: hypothetical protein Lokiarch_50740 [Candidatus Lokiarchaeum sp. GC14_75]
MSSVISWVKKEFVYIKSSFIEIVKSVIFFALASSGLGASILLRYLGYNGTVIISLGLIVECISLFLCYFLLREYLKSKDELKTPKS